MSFAQRFAQLLRSELERHGFGSISRSTLMAARRGEIFDVFWVRKSRWDESVQMVAGCWHPSIGMLKSPSLNEKMKAELLGGDVSPFGIGEEKWWHENGPSSHWDVPLVVDLAMRWQMSIRSLADLSALAAEVHRSFGEVGDRRVPAVPVIEGSDSDSVRFSESEFRERVKASLSVGFERATFQLFETARQIAFVRDRGDFVDVIEPRRASNGFHVYFCCFVSAKAVGQVRPELKSLLVQTNGSELGGDGLGSGIRVVEVSSLETAASTIIQRVQAQAFPLFASIASPEDFMRNMNSSWDGVLSEPLRQYWRIGSARGDC